MANIFDSVGVKLNTTGKISKSGGTLEFAINDANAIQFSRYSDSGFTSRKTSVTLIDSNNDASFPNKVSAATMSASAMYASAMQVTNTVTANYFDGLAARAKWADLAERYESDDEYAPGTLVCFGGSRQVTVATKEAHAVVSSKPGYILNNELKGVNVAIALCGQVPIKVVGPVKKFDKIYLHPARPGLGSTIINGDPIAITLEKNDNHEVKLVNCVTKFKF